MCLTCYSALETFRTFQRKVHETNVALSKIFKEVAGTTDVPLDEKRHYMIPTVIGKKEQFQNSDEEDSDLTCQFCEKIFKTRAKLSDHMKIPCELFPCNFCHASFNNITELRHHSKSLHWKQMAKNYKSVEKVVCHVCGLQFESNALLKTHESDTHLRMCKICDSVFKTPAILAKHKKITHGPKTILCEICGTRFALKFHLKQHIMRTHLKIMAQLVVCEVCGCNILPTSIKRHMKIHDPSEEIFECQFCKKQFSLSWNLAQHERYSVNH